MINKITIAEKQPKTTFQGSGIVPEYSRCPREIRELLLKAKRFSLNCTNDNFAYQIEDTELEQQIIRELHGAKINFAQMPYQINFRELLYKADKIS